MMAVISEADSEEDYCYAIDSENRLLASVDSGITWEVKAEVGENAILNVSNEGNGYVFARDVNGMIIRDALYVSVKGEDPVSYTNKISFGGTALSLCVFEEGSGFFARNQGMSYQTGYQTEIDKFTNYNTQEQKGYFSTWDQVSNSASACSRDGKYVIFGGREGYTNCYMSRDYGETWSETLESSSYGSGTDDVRLSGNGQMMAACGENNPWLTISTDFLGTFQRFGMAARSVDIVSDGSLIFVANNTGIFRATLASGNIAWKPTIISDQQLRRIRCNANGTKLIGLGTDGYIYYSHNGGVNWTKTSWNGVTDIAMSKKVK